MMPIRIHNTVYIQRYFEVLDIPVADNFHAFQSRPPLPISDGTTNFTVTGNVFIIHLCLGSWTGLGSALLAVPGNVYP